jgi:uncharacterized membrane protein YbaN (DUF454 family)
MLDSCARIEFDGSNRVVVHGSRPHGVTIVSQIGMLTTNSLFAAAQIVALGTIFPLFPAHPFSVWKTAFNTRSLSPELQHWRSLGRYFVHTDTKHWRLVSTVSQKLRNFAAIAVDFFILLQSTSCMSHAEGWAHACRQLNIFYVDQRNHQTEISASANTDTLLLLHGFPSSSHDFQGPFLDKLLTKFGRVITFDYPGPSKALMLSCIQARVLTGCAAVFQVLFY